jgi:hypothetical protein
MSCLIVCRCVSAVSIPFIEQRRERNTFYSWFEGEGMNNELSVVQMKEKRVINASICQ